MNINDYYQNILVPANVAVSAIRRAGLPIDIEYVHQLRDAWERELLDLEKYVEGEAAKVGASVRYSNKHVIPPAQLAAFLYGVPGLGLECHGKTPTGQSSTADEDLMHYASLSVPFEGDHPVVRAVLQIRSLAKAKTVHLDGFERSRRADGRCHPKFNWALRTARISAEDPPVHQIPERADKRVADAIKACIVPRLAPFRVQEWDPANGNYGGWDPRIHGSCWRWDIAGAEACWRAAALTDHYGVRDPIAWGYLRLGKDIHSKTASMIYGVPEGTYKKGTYERDAVGKQTFFAKQYGAKWRTVQGTIWKKARKVLSNEEAKRISENFDRGYTGLSQLYLIDQDLLGQRGYCEDGYGRRRRVDIPKGVRYLGNYEWDIQGLRWPREEPERGDEHRQELIYLLEHCFHVMANTPTQSMNATDNFYMLALAYHGEYVDLAVPSVWQAGGIPFPEAAEWQLHGGPGPGGAPFQAWHMNTVHDSGWGDGGPGYLEPTGKLLWRRCRAVPMDWRLQADIPYRIDFSAGPDMAHLTDYNRIAKHFALEPLADR